MKNELGKLGVSWISGTYSRKQGFVVNAIEVNGQWVIRGEDGTPKLMEGRKC